MVWWLLAVAHAGYGDAVNGHPSPDERLLHLYTNAARVDPEAFEADYNAGGCSYYSDFSEDEQTPKHPYLHHPGLNEVARIHSADMLERDYFSHDTLGGANWYDRISPYYEGGSLGENIAAGYATAFDAVFLGWMCSETGHRGAIMSGGYIDLGVGIADRYYTQDFGGGSGQAGRHVAMAAHTQTGKSLTFFASVYDPDGSPPSSVELVLGPARHAMALTWGVEDRGVYSLMLGQPPGCSPYAVEVTFGATSERFPEHGWYGVGDCAWDDPGAQWIAGEDSTGGGGGTGGGGTGGDGGGEPGTDPWADWESEDTGDARRGADEKTKAAGGCSTAPGSVGWLALLALAAPLQRRRRQR